MFAKLKNKLQATRFEFTLHCHSLQPWPVGNKAIAIGWQRGKRRRGATNSVFPLPSADKQGTVVRINEKFTCTATLYKAPGADKNSQTGPFKKKCIILAVLETDGRSNATAALGRVVIDLSEFASIDGTELRTFQVACNKGIHAAVGQPQLTITIRCRWKKAGADMTEDEVASMSTDTTGSNLAYNWLGNILTFGKGLSPAARARRDGEQDLSNTAGAAPRETMDTIGEEDGDGSTKAVESSFGSGTFSEDWQHAAQAEYDVAGTLNLHDHDDDDYAAGARTQPSPASPGPSRPASTTPTPAADKAADNGRWRLEKMADSAAGSSGRNLGPPTPVPSSERQPTVKAPSRRSRRRNVRTQTESSGKMGVSGMPGFEDSSAMQDELLTSAALELALYNSDRPLVAGKPAGRVVHAASRRLARTLVCLGRQDGLPFGQLALAHISSRVIRHRADVAELAYWWTNACHLRGFLQSLNLTVAPGAPGDETSRVHWSSMAFVSKLLAQEKFIFDEVVSHMWTHVLVPRISLQRAAKGSAGPPLNKRAAHEAALRKWVECFEGLNATLKDLGRDGHTATLRHQVLLELLKRTDILLFHYLINPAGGSVDGDRPSTPASSAHSVPGTPQARGSATGMPVLDDSMLFFGRGSLCFGTGMTLKMAVARFQQWAFSEGGLKEIWSQLPEKGQSLFSLLRGAADLLMMPKDMLLDEGIRSDVVENLPLDAVLYVVEHFHPDEYAADRIPADVKDALRRSVAGSKAEEGLPDGPAAPPVLDVEGECTYYSPTDDMVMEKVEMGDEPGLEYDEDSEDELEALGALCSGSGSNMPMVPALRFKLLHNLWNAGVPRSRRLLSNDDAGPM